MKTPHPQSPTDTNDPLAVLRSAGQLSTGSGTTLLVLQNFHRFPNATEILRAVQKQVSAGKHTQIEIGAPTAPPVLRIEHKSSTRVLEDRWSSY